MPIVFVTMLHGRTEEQKAKVAEAITKALHEHARSTPDQTHVVFEDVPATSWAIGGKLLSNKS